MKFDNKKKFLSLIFGIVFVLCIIIPICVNATGETPPNIEVEYLGTEPSNPLVGQSFKVKYKISPQPFEYEEELREKQIVLVLDKSGSMKNENKMTNLKTAAINFINSLTTGTDGQTPKIKNLKIGIVSYDKSGIITSELTSVTETEYVNTANIESLKNKINELNADGGTNTGDGLRKAAYLLNNSYADNTNKTIIFMSDGIPTYYSELYERQQNNNKWWLPNNGYVEGIDKGFYTSIDEENPSGNRSIKVQGPGNDDDSNGSCLNYAKTIGDIIKSQINCNVFSIGYGLGNENSDSNKKMKAIYKSMGGIDDNFFASGTDENAINSVFQSIAGKIVKTNFDDVKLELDLDENFTVESGLEITNGNSGKITINPIVYRKDSENANRYIADEQIVEFTVKAQKEGDFKLIKGGKITYTDIDGNTKEKSLSQQSISIEKNNDIVMKILEIEPADSFKLTNSGGISIDPGENYKNQMKIPIEENTSVEVNGITKYVSITHLTMPQFISMVDEISGQYDAVVIGRENRMIERKWDGGNHRFFDYILTEHSSIRKYREYTNPYEQLHSQTNQNVLNEYKTKEVEYMSENDITDKRAEEIKKMYNSNQLVYMDRNIGITESYTDIVKYKYDEYNEKIENGATHHPINGTKLYKLYSELNNCNRFSKTGSLTYYDPAYAEKLKIESVPVIEDDITIERIVSDYESLENQNKRPNVISHEKQINDGKLNIKVEANENEDLYFKLYIDKDGDGLFKSENEVVPIEVSKQVNTNKYQISYNFGHDFWGYLGWKLEVLKENNNIKTNIIDFDTSIERPENVNPRKINILQLDIRNWGLDDISSTQSFKNVINEISDDYKITVERISIQDFNSNIVDLDKYDGILIGFGNNNRSDWNYQLSLERIEQLKSYIISGRSVVFTSDTMANTSDVGNNKVKSESTSSLTQAFRDIIGQSRYIDPYNISEKDLDESTTIPHDSLPEKISDKYSAGITLGGNTGGWIVDNSSKIINRSQNTNYPFKLNDTINLGPLDRSQLYQLNLEDEDIVPLYNIVNSNGNYINDEDSRNYYHTYSKGNITYISTLPTNNNEFPEDELKLFINSLIKLSGNFNNPPVINSRYMDNKISNGDIINLTEIEDGFSFTTEAVDKDNDNVQLKVLLNEDDEPIKSSNGFVVSGTQLSVHISKDKLNEAYSSDDKKINIKVIARDARDAISEENYILDMSKVIVHGIYMGINNTTMIDTNKRIFPKGAAVTFGASFNGISNGQIITLELGKDISNDNSYLDSNPKMYAINNNNELVDLNTELSKVGKKYSGSIANLPDVSDKVLIIYTQAILKEYDTYKNIISIDNGVDVPATVEISSDELPDLF